MEENTLFFVLGNEAVEGAGGLCVVCSPVSAQEAAQC